MNLEEAKEIAAIASDVDGGCRFCVRAVVEALNEKFPEFRWGYKDYEPVTVEHTVEQQDPAPISECKFCGTIYNLTNMVAVLQREVEMLKREIEQRPWPPTPWIIT